MPTRAILIIYSILICVHIHSTAYQAAFVAHLQGHHVPFCAETGYISCRFAGSLPLQIYILSRPVATPAGKETRQICSTAVSDRTLPDCPGNRPSPGLAFQASPAQPPARSRTGPLPQRFAPVRGKRLPACWRPWPPLFPSSLQRSPQGRGGVAFPPFERCFPARREDRLPRPLPQPCR